MNKTVDPLEEEVHCVVGESGGVARAGALTGIG